MFCRYCGKELLDDAVICTGCGVWVDGKKTTAETGKTDCEKAPVEKQSAEKWAKFSKIFGMVAFSIISLVLFLMIIGIGNIGEYFYEGYEFGTGYYSYWDEDYFEAAWVFAWFGLGLAIASFVFACKIKKCMGVKYVSTLVFILSIAVFFAPIAFFG